MFIEISRSYSFRNLAQYCLHDIDAPTSGRVDFVETRNLATQHPQAAWRIMASRTYVQSELKEKAGVSLAGRKDGKPVGHLLISWGREEADAQQLEREGMIHAAEGALKAIGADDRQAIIVAHNDTSDRNPHCHVIVNLIGDDGRLLKSYNDHKKLSRFALDEEIRLHGEPVVMERFKRWHDRDAGEQPAPMKKKPRHLYELEKAAECGNIDGQHAFRLKNEQRAMEKEKASVNARQQRNRERLREILNERERRVRAEHDALVRRAKSNARKIYEASWRDLHASQQIERSDFNRREKSLRGSIENALRMVDWFKLFERPRDSGKESLKDLFQTLTSEAKRRERLIERQQIERDELRAEQRQAEHDAERTAKQAKAKKLELVRDDYVKKSARMKDRQRRNMDAVRKAQQRITRERGEALTQFREHQQEQKRKQIQKQMLQREFANAARRDSVDKKSGDTDRTDQGSGNFTENTTKPKRTRKPRDPGRSRRKRDLDKRSRGGELDFDR